MRKYKAVCLVVMAAVAVLGSIFSAIYAAQLSAYVEQMKRSSRADMVYLRGYIRQLENELTDAIAGLAEETAPPAESDAVVETEAESETAPETDTGDLPALGQPEGYETEAETETETEAETEAPILYTLAIYNGRIGVFDATGRVLCTLNVFVPSLPATDYEALLAGVPIYSQEKMWDILDKYA